MNLTKQQIETIYKVTNLLDCGILLQNERIIFMRKLTPVLSIFPNDNPIEVHTKLNSMDFDNFPTFEDLKPILDLIPVIE